MKLYEIANNINEVLNSDLLAEDEQAFTDTLESLQGAFDQKSENVGKFILNLEAEEQAIKTAVDRMELRRAQINKKVGWLKGYLKTMMETTGNTELKFAEFVAKIQKNPPAVVIDNQDKVPADFRKTKIIESIDKIAIKKYLQEQEADWAHLAQSTRIVFK